MSEIVLAKNGTTLQKYQYTYGQINTSGTLETSKNNGQLAQVESWIGTTQEYRQQYYYDSVNRLTRSVEKYGTSLASTAYDIKYRYDAFGNREQRSADNSGNTAIVQKWVESGDISKTNNRYTSGVTYDAAGNITSDSRFRNLLYGYDANGRQNYSAQANGSSPVTTIFDGAGRRVATKASGYLSVMVYDAAGKLAAEYSQFTAPTTANVDFITPNYQGSTSVITDNAGAVKSRHDYLPFGEEIGDGVGSRTTAKKFSQSDTVRHKYAGMEIDDATGLNHTLWRKDDNWSGRWTSPDPYGGSMTTADPQSFNRYTYCDNDPVNHIDPLGLALSDIGVYQTTNATEARLLDNVMLKGFRGAISPHSTFKEGSGGGKKEFRAGQQSGTTTSNSSASGESRNHGRTEQDNYDELVFEKQVLDKGGLQLDVRDADSINGNPPITTNEIVTESSIYEDEEFFFRMCRTTLFHRTRINIISPVELIAGLQYAVTGAGTVPTDADFQDVLPGGMILPVKVVADQVHLDGKRKGCLKSIDRAVVESSFDVTVRTGRGTTILTGTFTINDVTRENPKFGNHIFHAEFRRQSGLLARP